MPMSRNRIDEQLLAQRRRALALIEVIEAEKFQSKAGPLLNFAPWQELWELVEKEIEWPPATLS
jgi:hypothetical protein